MAHATLPEIKRSPPGVREARALRYEKLEPATRGPVSYRSVLDFSSVVLVSALRWMPRGMAVVVGGLCGSLAGALARRKTRRMEANLRAAGCIRPRPARRNGWRNAGMTFAEMLWCLSRSPDRALRHVDVSGFDVLVEALRQGRGVLLVSAHIGNWELVPLVAARAAPTAVVARHLATLRLQRRLHVFRECGGVRTLVRGSEGTSISAYRWLGHGGVLGCMMDHAIGDSRLRVPFLGRSANLPLGPMRLACRSGSAVVSGFARSSAGGRTRVVFARLREAEVTDAVAACCAVARALEDEIGRCPEHWLCIHRRRAPWSAFTV